MFELPKSRFFIMALMLWAFTSLTALAQGVVREVRGQVTISTGKGAPIPAVVNSTVALGQVVTTGPNSLVIIRFPDATVVALEQNTSFTVREYNYDEKQPSAMAAFFGLAQGAMRTLTGRINQNNREAVRIATPVATMGIRGSDAITIHVAITNTTTNVVTQGVMTVTPAAGGGATVTVTVGQATASVGLTQAQFVSLQAALNGAGALPGLNLTAIANATVAVTGAQGAAAGGIGGAAGAAAAAAAAAVAAAASGNSQDNPVTVTTGTTGTR